MKRSLLVIAAVVLLAGAGWSARTWFTTWRYIEKTDDAYIRSEITQISSKVTGYVKTVRATDNTLVAAGEELIRIEDLEFRARLGYGQKKREERKASLMVAQSKSVLQLSRIEAFKAQLEAAQAEQIRRGGELRRFGNIYSSGIISEQDYEAVVTAEKKGRAEVAGAVANLDAAQKEHEVLLAEERRIEAELRQQEEELKLPAQELADTVISAPIAGVVGNRRVRVGQYVKPGTLLLAIVPRQEFWVEANFKEVQLARMRDGQPVTIVVDAYPGTPLAGQLESLSPASGAEFSLIPPENATGNFTKIVQRVPVKIRFQAGQPLLGSLRSGMSVVVKMDTRSHPGAAASDREPH